MILDRCWAIMGHRMSFQEYIDLVYDVGSDSGFPLLKITVSSIETGTTPVWVSGDKRLLRIFLKRLNATTGAYEAVEIPEGYSLVFAAKKSDLSGDALFSATGFITAGTGGDLHYEADLDLNTTGLASALAGKELVVVCDLEIQNPGNTRRRTFQINAKILKQAYAGETPVASGEPPYPDPDQIAVRNPGSSGNYVIDGDGVLRLLNVGSEEYETIELRIESGISLRVEDGACAVYVNGIRRGLI